MDSAIPQEAVKDGWGMREKRKCAKGLCVRGGGRAREMWGGGGMGWEGGRGGWGGWWESGVGRWCGGRVGRVRRMWGGGEWGGVGELKWEGR